MSPAQAICRLRRISADVQLIIHESAHSRRLSYSGVSTCKSSLCPLCAPKWQQTRAQEITTAIDHWGAKRVVFLTLTMRHHPGMALALQHRILTSAFGHLWSGRAGQDLAAELGGKPESVRAHDRTWSKEHGWHPHLHGLLFLQGNGHTAAELEELVWQRWTGREAVTVGPVVQYAPSKRRGALGGALHRMKNFCAKTLACAARIESQKCESVRGCLCLECVTARAKRLFGSRLIPKRAPLFESIRRLSQTLDAFTEDNLMPTRERGADLSFVREGDRAPNYLAKLGLELTWAASKRVHTDAHGVTHYPYWALAHIATEHGHPLRVLARRAWHTLFEATRATQSITFSSREKLGLGPDPYAEGDEPPEQQPGELSRLGGLISGANWDALKKQQRHGLLVTIATAFDLNLLERLPYVEPPHDRSPTDAGWAGVPSSRGPPPRPHVTLEPWERAFRVAAAEKRGGAVVRAAWSDLARPAGDTTLWLEELRFKLEQLGVKARPRGFRTVPIGHPW